MGLPKRTPEIITLLFIVFSMVLLLVWITGSAADAGRPLRADITSSEINTQKGKLSLQFMANDCAEADISITESKSSQKSAVINYGWGRLDPKTQQCDGNSLSFKFGFCSVKLASDIKEGVWHRLEIEWDKPNFVVRARVDENDWSTWTDPRKSGAYPTPEALILRDRSIHGGNFVVEDVKIIDLE